MNVFAWYVQIIFWCLYYIPTSSKYIYILSHIRDIRTKTTEVPFLSQTKNFLNNKFHRIQWFKSEFGLPNRPIKTILHQEKQNILLCATILVESPIQKSEREIDPI
jgi:hypothetical protein